MFGLADCNNFYVSCERVFNPSLNGKPVIVLSNNDGCVISRSQEAKDLGISMGEPLFKLKDLVKRDNIRVYSSNFPLYADMSQRVMDTIISMVPAAEIYSIDEAFINFDGIAIDKLQKLASDISQQVKNNTGIPLSIGVSKTKTLAKIASKLCKKYPKLNNSCVMIKQSNIDKVLKSYPVNDVWGIGRQYSKMLYSNNITTVEQFLCADPRWVRSKMNVTGLKSWKELKGTPCFGLEENIHDKQQICTSRSFAKDLFDHEEVIRAVAKFTSSSAQKLRAQNGVALKVMVFLYTNPFKENHERDYKTIFIPLEYPTDNTLELVKIVCRHTAMNLKKGCGYKKAGVVISSISKKEHTPGFLFDSGRSDKGDLLMKCLDDINAKYGRESIVTGTQGPNRIVYNMDRLSPKYTTCWDDIIKVKV